MELDGNILTAAVAVAPGTCPKSEKFRENTRGDEGTTAPRGRPREELILTSTADAKPGTAAQILSVAPVQLAVK